MPNRTWTFYGEIVHDSLSQMPMLGHRVEVRDISGAVHSVLFYPTGGLFDFGELRAGSTLFVRYAQRCFFSDLSTEVSDGGGKGWGAEQFGVMGLIECVDIYN